MATTFKSGLVSNLSASRRGGQSIASPGPLSWLGSLRAPPQVTGRRSPTAFIPHSRTQPQTPNAETGRPAAPTIHTGAQSACAPTARAPPLPKLSASTRRRGPRLGTLYQCQGRASASTRTPARMARAPAASPQRAYLNGPTSARTSIGRQAFCCGVLGVKLANSYASVGSSPSFFFQTIYVEIEGRFVTQVQHIWKLFPN